MSCKLFTVFLSLSFLLFCSPTISISKAIPAELKSTRKCKKPNARKKCSRSKCCKPFTACKACIRNLLVRNLAVGNQLSINGINIATLVSLANALSSTSPQGIQNIAQVLGTIGATGPKGAQGIAGALGAIGAAGAQGAVGGAGVPGIPGIGGVLGYLYVYNTITKVIALEEDISFDFNGPLSADFTHTPGSTEIHIVNAGVYLVTFSVSSTNPNQFSLFKNGAIATGSIYGSGAGTQQNTGQIVVAASASDILTLRNHTSSAGIILQPQAGGTQFSVNASVLITRIA